MIESDAPQPMSALQRPRKVLTAITAAAQRITNFKLSGSSGGANASKSTSSDDWQTEAWEMYDMVGEQHFLTSTVANRVGAGRLYVGEIADDPTEPPVQVEEGLPAEVFASLGSATARQQIATRLAANLFVAGDSWVVGIPRDLLPPELRRPNSVTPEPQAPTGPLPPDPYEELSPPAISPEGQVLTLDELEWRALSVDEVKFSQQGSEVTLHLGDGPDDQIKTSPDDLILIRVWRSHPKRWWEADSPTRACLTILRELVGLTMHVSAQVDSRLAGAGVYIVPQSAEDAMLARQGDPADADEDPGDDPFTDALLTAMIKPISDRSNASAYVPLVTVVPDESAEKFRHITFSAPLDAEARELREEALRRLALSQDCPPEVLLGMGDSNHWAAWLVREDTITTHIEPPLSLICDALTTQFLRPILIDQGMSPEQAERYVIWYDVSHLIMRPNRTADAVTLHEAGVISDAALRDAAGFSDEDAPAVTDPAVTLVLEMVAQAPSLAATPGIPALVEQVRAVLAGETAQPSTPELEPVPDEEETPTGDAITEVSEPEDTGDTPVEQGPPGLAAAAVKGTGPVTLHFDQRPLDPRLVELALGEEALGRGR